MEYYFDDPPESKECVTFIINDLAERKGKLNILLSGGRSILPVLDAIKYLPPALLQESRFFLADERIGGDYNSEMLNEYVFTGLIAEGKINPDQLIFPDIRKSIDDAASEYERRLSNFDLAFLGVGEDGHVASLFPEHPVLTSSRLVDTINDSPKPPPERITVTYRTFSRYTAVVLLFFGESKTDAFTLFKNSDSYYECPAVYFKKVDTLHIIHNQRSTA